MTGFLPRETDLHIEKGIDKSPRKGLGQKLFDVLCRLLVIPLFRYTQSLGIIFKNYLVV